MGHDKRHTGNLSQLRPLLRESMVDLDPVAQDAVITLLALFLQGEGETESISEYRYVNKSLNEADVYYAIHDSDLLLLKDATSVAAALVSGLQNPILVIGNLVVTLFQYRRKRIKLTGEQGIVLKALKQAKPPGWSTEQLLPHLPFTRDLTMPDINLILESLKCVSRTDGTETSLVLERNGLWLVSDV